MYATRPRSLCRKFTSALSVQPAAQEAPCSGYLVVTDEESEEMDAFCCGVCKNDRINKLPFPQDKILKVVHVSEYDEASVTKVWFIPVLDQPLSSNRYYVIKAKGRQKGLAYTCSREEEFTGTCCFNSVKLDPKPSPFDHRDIYQQVEIRPYQNGGFYAKPVAWDGFPPKFLRRKGWEVFTARSFNIRLAEAQGLHTPRLSELPELIEPLPHKRSPPVITGKWYCPCVFVKEEAGIKHQMEKSLFYELTLKQWWEEIYSCDSTNNAGNIVTVDACVKRLVPKVCGMEAVKDGRRSADGFVWFRVREEYRRRASIGLSPAIFDRMTSVQEQHGWFDYKEKVVRVESVQEIKSNNRWKKFGCYVLVESFVLRRMDERLVFNYNFRNTKRIECRCH